MKYLLLLLIVGCATPASYPSVQMTEFKLVVEPTPKVLIATKCAAAGLRVHPSREVLGCSIPNPAKRECRIIVPPISSTRNGQDMITWGEEVAHCVYDNLHK